MKVVHLIVVLATLFALVDHCGGQQDPPRRFEVKKDEKERRNIKQQAKGRAKASRGKQRHETSKLTISI